ncbi:MAG TPA: methyltransferase domain-containing protein [Actinomycetota bacterium]
MTDLVPTGERTLPSVPSENYWYRRHVAAYRFARRHARGRVLDAGCGEGYGTRLLGHAPVVGLDLDAAVAARAARRYPAARFLAADLCRLSVRPSSVDTIVALQVLEHLWCPDEFLAACREALRPGGTLVVSTPNRDTFPAGRNPSHVHEYDRRELEALLRRHFDAVTVVATTHGPLLRLLDRFLGEPVQHRLVRRPYEQQPAWLRAVLRTVRSHDLGITRDAERGLDLVAVGTRYDRERG